MSELTNHETQNLDEIKKNVETYNEKALTDLASDQLVPDAPEVTTTDGDPIAVMPAESDEPATSGYVDADFSVPPTVDQETVNVTTGDEAEPTIGVDTSNEESDQTVIAGPSIPNYRDEEWLRGRNRKDFEAFAKLSYIDLYNRLQTTKNELQDLIGIKKSFDQLGDLSLDSNTVAQMDAAQKAEMHKSINQFYDEYGKNRAEGKRIIKLITAMLQCFPGDEVTSTAFISKSMCESAEVRADDVSTREVNGADNSALLLARIAATKAAYENRTAFPMLFNKLRYPNNVLKIWKEFMQSPEESLKYINKVLTPVFNDKNMARFRNSIFNALVRRTMDVDVDKKPSSDVLRVQIFFMTFWLAKIYEKEFQSGRCAEVKVFIMNAYDSDVTSKIYDLPGGPEYFYSLVYVLFTVLFTVSEGGYTAKQLNSVINSMLSDLLKVLETEFEERKKEFPGRVVEKETNFNAMTGGTFEDVDLLIDYSDEDEKTPEELAQERLDSYGDDEYTHTVYKLVEELPEEGEENTVYLIRKDDHFDSYVWDELGYSKDTDYSLEDGDTLLDESTGVDEDEETAEGADDAEDEEPQPDEAEAEEQPEAAAEAEDEDVVPDDELELEAKYKTKVREVDGGPHHLMDAVNAHMAKYDGELKAVNWISQVGNLGYAPFVTTDTGHLKLVGGVRSKEFVESLIAGNYPEEVDKLKIEDRGPDLHEPVGTAPELPAVQESKKPHAF